MSNSKVDSHARDGRADFYVNIGRKAGRDEGLAYGGFWGFVAGLTAYFLLSWLRS